MSAAEKLSYPHYEHWHRLLDEALWTPQIRRFAKQSHRVLVQFKTVPEAPRWHRDAAFVTLSFYKGRSTLMTAHFAGMIRAGNGPEENTVYAPQSGAWSLYLQPNTSSHAFTSLMTIPSGSKLRFEACLDYHTNGLMRDRGLHGDVLKLRFEKGKVAREIDLDTQVSLHNGVRFGEKF